MSVEIKEKALLFNQIKRAANTSEPLVRSVVSAQNEENLC